MEIPAQKPIKTDQKVAQLHVWSHTSATGWENHRPGNPATEVPSYCDHCNRVTETGKSIWECGATWQIQLNGLTSSNPTYDIHTKFHGDLICRFDITISALMQDYWKRTTPRHVYGGSFYIIIQPTPTKFGGHIEIWLAINIVGLGFPIFFPAAVH